MIHKKTLLSVVSRLMVVVLGISITSCLTFEESYVFKKNGSGSMKYLIDMSEIASLMKLNAESDSSGDSESLSFQDVADLLSGMDGISKVKVLDDEDKGFYGVSFDFAGITPLNQALNVLMGDEENEDFTFFSFDGNVITHNHLLATDALPPGMDDPETEEQVSGFLQQMKYKLNFSFASPVKVVYSGAESEITGKKDKAVSIETNFRTLLEDASTLNSSIVLK
ncbi:MAG: hypothetical protein R3C61_04035 [Bacteroidia bacterium]